MDGSMDGWIDERAGGRTCGRGAGEGRRVDGQTMCCAGRRTDGRMDRMSFISGEQENTSKNEGNRRTNVISGSREHRKLRF